jgi:hypothetical protein
MVIRVGRGFQQPDDNTTAFSVQIADECIPENTIICTISSKANHSGEDAEEYRLHCLMKHANIMINGKPVQHGTSLPLMNGDCIGMMGGTDFIFHERQGHRGDPDFPDHEDDDTWFSIIRIVEERTRKNNEGASEESPQKRARTEVPTCAICHDGIPTHIFRICLHLILCENCYKHPRMKIKRCPVCNVEQKAECPRCETRFQLHPKPVFWA